jgi:hypothetical protein
MTDTINKNLQQQDSVNFFKMFHPDITHYPSFIIGLLNYMLYTMLYEKWELLDNDSIYTRFHLSSFCRHNGLFKETVKYHIKELSTGKNPLLKKKSYSKSIYIAFTDNMLECLQIKTVRAHLKRAMNNHYKKNSDELYVIHPLFLQWKEKIKCKN